MVSWLPKTGRWSFTAVVAILLGGLFGCSGGSSGEGPVTHPVRGKVVSAGGKPWTGGTITFRSVSDPSTVATGTIQADGTFILETHYLAAGLPRTKPGAVAGEHTVTLEEAGVTTDRDGNPSRPPVLVRKRHRVEAGANDLVIESGK